MISKSIKKIGFFCLCLAGLSLAGCFHIPDEDWLPSRNRTKDIEKENIEVEQAINSLVDGFNMISTQRNDMGSEDSEEIVTEEGNENTEEIEIELDKNEETDTISEENDTISEENDTISEENDAGNNIIN